MFDTDNSDGQLPRSLDALILEALRAPMPDEIGRAHV